MTIHLELNLLVMNSVGSLNRIFNA